MGRSATACSLGRFESFGRLQTRGRENLRRQRKVIGVNARGVERVMAAWDSQETGRLVIGPLVDAGYFAKLLAALELALFRAVVDDSLGDALGNTWNQR
jgi:hypothetical protein